MIRLLLSVALAVGVIVNPATASEQEGEQKMLQAEGSFEVKLTPVSAEGESPARMTLEKVFTGDFTGRGEGQMMAGGNHERQSRVYVALETLIGSLAGKQGSFILAHRGTMSPSGQQLSIVIVPDSGTGELANISGSMEIDIVAGVHNYTINYSLTDE